MTDAAIVSTARTPIGTARKGTLLDVSAFDLAKYAMGADAFLGPKAFRVQSAC